MEVIFEQVPLAIEEDLNQNSTEWIDGKCVKMDEGAFVTYYTGHKVEEMAEEVDGESVVRKICSAIPVRLKKGCHLSDVPTDYADILYLFVRDNIEQCKWEIIERIREFDKSDAVNALTVNGQRFWLDRDTRVSLTHSTSIRKSMGEKITNLWYNGFKLTIPCDVALQMLSQLEMYALACYNRTAEHIANVTAISDAQSLIDYDYKSGYPKQLVFNTDSNV